jgi:hypothetical protein
VLPSTAARMPGYLIDDLGFVMVLRLRGNEPANAVSERKAHAGCLHLMTSYRVTRPYE